MDPINVRDPDYPSAHAWRQEPTIGEMVSRMMRSCSWESSNEGTDLINHISRGLIRPRTGTCRSNLYFIIFIMNNIKGVIDYITSNYIYSTLLFHNISHYINLLIYSLLPLISGFATFCDECFLFFMMPRNLDSVKP